MKPRRSALTVLAVAALPVAAAPARAQSSEPPPRPFLRKVIQLNDSQLAVIEKGEIVAKLLPTTDKPEIAAFGVVKTAGNPDVLLRLAKDIRRFRQVPQIPELGLFSSPPTIEDLKGLHHPPDDINALKRCKPGSCDVKLGSAALERVATPDGKGLYLLSLYRTRIDPPTGMLGGVLMGKVRDGIETAMKENLKVARDRLAGAK